jgi:hypothetical protein
MGPVVAAQPNDEHSLRDAAVVHMIDSVKHHGLDQSCGHCLSVKVAMLECHSVTTTVLSDYK